MATCHLFLPRERGTYTRESQLQDYPFIDNACVGKFKFNHEGHDHIFTCIQLFPCEHIFTLLEIRALLKQSARSQNVYLRCCNSHPLNLTVAKAQAFQKSRIIERCDVETTLDLKSELSSILTHDIQKAERRESRRLEKELKADYIKSSCKAALFVLTLGVVIVLVSK